MWLAGGCCSLLLGEVSQRQSASFFGRVCVSLSPPLSLRCLILPPSRNRTLLHHGCEKIKKMPID